MNDNTNGPKRDPLEEMLKRQKEVLNVESKNNNDIPTPTFDEDLNDEVVSTQQTPPSEVVINNDNSSPLATYTDSDDSDDMYGENDMDKQIEQEDLIAEQMKEAERQRVAAERAKQDAKKTFMPPDERDMNYHNEAIGYQTEKLSKVSMMINKVVAKYRLISGGVSEGDIPQRGILGKFHLMGELIDIYHNSGELVTPTFEKLLLSNWIMPDGTLAINNINDEGFVVDKTMTGEARAIATRKEPEKIEKDDNGEVKSYDVPTVIINVEKNTPVTINVDESIIPNKTEVNEVNIIVKEVTEKEMQTSNVIVNTDEPGVITPYDPGFNDVPITLPLSAYRCVMRAINWSDFIALTVPSSQNSSDVEIKKWSIIYKHLKSPSIGAFKDFEDFLKKTKYYDRELLMWAILVATADDEETLSFNCLNENCKHKVHVIYNPRSIVHYDPKLNPPWYERAHNASVGADAFEVWKEANAKIKRYRLPSTGIFVEISNPSAYEFINNKLPLVQELFQRYRPGKQLDKRSLSDPELVEFEYLSSHALYITAMIIKPKDKDGEPIKDKNGKEIEYRFTNWEQIEDIIRNSLNADDSGILMKLIQEVGQKQSPVSFRIEDVVCPSCKRREEYIPISDIGESLLFQVSRRYSNTQINLIELEQK